MGCCRDEYRVHQKVGCCGNICKAQDNCQDEAGPEPPTPAPLSRRSSMRAVMAAKPKPASCEGPGCCSSASGETQKDPSSDACDAGCCAGAEPAVTDTCCDPKSCSPDIDIAPACSAGTREAVSASAKRSRTMIDPMCPCCVQSMLKTNVKVLDILMSRVAEAQSQFKRCCIAFADLCCAKSRTETGCCESTCDEDDEVCGLPQLSKDPYQIHPSAVHMEKVDGSPIKQEASAQHPDDEEEILLEVIGMDCPDCLSKVTGAVKVLAGAEVSNADGVRGLVRVRYDPGRIDVRAIQTFAARASGFTINILDAAETDGRKTLLLPLAFRCMPPDHMLEPYQVQLVESPSLSVWQKFSRRINHAQHTEPEWEVDVSISLNSPTEVKVRDILKFLAPYGATLRPNGEDHDHSRINRDIRNISLRTLASLILTIPILVLVWSSPPLLPAHQSQAIQLGLTTLIIIVAWSVYSGSFRSAYYLHRADLGVLTAFSTLTSYIFSVVAFAFELSGRNIGEPFFETVGLLITLIFAGRTLQASTRKLGLRAVGHLGHLQPDTARMVAPGSERTEWIDVRLLHYNDVLRVQQGEIVPTDGVVVRGNATVDESSLTGESIPVPKTRGSTITAGTTLTTGSVDMIVTHLVPENAISAIMDAVSSSSTGSDYQDLADRMAGWLLPIAGVCCLVAFIGWMLLERFRRGQGWGEAVISAIGYAIAIAAVSCPCALAIAVTLVTSISMATTVQEGVLFRSVQALLTAHSVRALAFDKTGTLSQGVMAVQQTFYDDDPLSLRLLHAITGASKHPVSESAKRYLETHHPDVALSAAAHTSATVDLRDVEVVPGKGISATFFGFPIKAGNAAFTNTESHPLVLDYLEKGMTILVITLGQQVIGLFGMKDQPRRGVYDLIRALDRAGKSVSLVSGDNPSAVHGFARDVGIEPDATHAGQSPSSKATVVKALKNSLPQGAKVAFIGDGINDTIALSTADVSIATGSASNASSDIILLSPDVPRAIQSILATSRVTRNHVIVSLTFCAVYFIVAILLASGVTGWRIPPAYAGLGELVSILPVLLVGSNLALYKAIQRRIARGKA